MTKSLVQKYVGQILDIEADRPYIDNINNTRPMLFFAVNHAVMETQILAHHYTETQRGSNR
jgi:hypothetical protein